MKKVIGLILVTIFCFTVPVFAVNMPDTSLFTLCNATIADGNCDPTIDMRNFGQDAFSDLYCTASGSGTAATSWAIKVLGADVSTVFGTGTPAITSHTYTVATADTAQFMIEGVGGWRYLKGNTTLTGGDATSAFTLKCKGVR